MDNFHCEIKINCYDGYKQYCLINILADSSRVRFALSCPQLILCISFLLLSTGPQQPESKIDDDLFLHTTNVNVLLDHVRKLINIKAHDR
jgi:hypothetical protein